MPSRLPVHGQRAAPGPPQKAAGPQDAAQALLLFYADSASSLTDLIEHPPSVSEAEDTVAES